MSALYDVFSIFETKKKYIKKINYLQLYYIIIESYYPPILL